MKQFEYNIDNSVEVEAGFRYSISQNKFNFDCNLNALFSFKSIRKFSKLPL